MITIFTPTYNRAYIIGKLYISLQSQDCFDFEWLVIDDGSTDNTPILFDKWKKDNNLFPIHYLYVENGGKQRAINKAMTMANGEYFFIVDSDDMLSSDAISFINSAFQTILVSDSSFIGISCVKEDLNGNPLCRKPIIDSHIGYVDANNLERERYGLQADMAEVFFTDKLRKYSFPVWKGETFTPEAVVWDKMALDGYKLRWFNKVTYFCEYQQDGLTNSTWKLLNDNPMGYAMLFNTKLMYIDNLTNRLKIILQFISCCCLAKEYKYIGKSRYPFLACLVFPIGYVLSLRRRMQIKKFVG